jgi:hypothetical protein
MAMMFDYGFRLERLVAAFDRSERRLMALASKSPENESVATITAHLRAINGLRKVVVR